MIVDAGVDREVTKQAASNVEQVHPPLLVDQAGLITPSSSHASLIRLLGSGGKERSESKRRGTASIPLRSAKSHHSMPAGVLLLLRFEQRTGALKVHAYRNYREIGSIVSLAHQPTSVNGATAMAPVKRSRSFSQPVNLYATLHHPQDSDDDVIVDVLNDASDPEDAANGALAMHKTGTGQSRRRGSLISATLSHLVPNCLLMRTSRRISSSAPHSECSCRSCSARVTPYWRDGWSADVMLCNACGLRFQKFATRCGKCSYIPRKEDGPLRECPQCKSKWSQVGVIGAATTSKTIVSTAATSMALKCALMGEEVEPDSGSLLQCE